MAAMPNVVRFTLPTARDFEVQGAGAFHAGVLDVDANNLALITRTRFLVQPYGAVEVGIVDSATPPPALPAVPVAPNPDPYPQYPTMDEIVASDALRAALERAPLRRAALVRGKRLRATTTGSRSVPANGVTVGTIVPTSTASAIPSAARRAAWTGVVNPAMRVVSGRVVQASPNSWVRAASTILTYAPGTQVGPGLRIDTRYAGAAIDVILFNNGSAVQRILVDDVLVATITPAVLSAAGVSGGGHARVPLTFTNAADRLITMETWDGDASFVGYDTEATVTIRYPLSPAKGPKVAVHGDSWTEGSGRTSAGFGFATWVSWHMGWPDLWKLGSGGTGYVADGPRQSLVDRYVNDVITLGGDIVILAFGINDATAWSSSPASVLTAATTVYDAIAAGLPNAELIVVGPWSPKGAGYAQAEHVAMDLALQPLVEARGLRYISPIQEGWITGNGRVGATTGNGNSDIYIASDGSHPTDAGHEYLGWRLAGHLAMPYLPAT